MDQPAETAGHNTRDDILRAACRLSATDGLEGLTIGKLAKAVGMSKSGLFAHFGSKEELQLATIERVQSRIVQRIYVPAKEQDHGLPRLIAFMDGWFTHVDNSPYPGGCIMAQAGAEFDGRPGAVRDCLAELGRKWLGSIAYEANLAMTRGELHSEPDAEQVAFELCAYGHEGNWAKQLLGDEQAYAAARRATIYRLRQQATEKGIALLDDLEQQVQAGTLTAPQQPAGAST